MSKSASDDPTGNKGKPYTDEQKKQMDSVFTRFMTLLIEPVATSVGVEMIAGEPVVYIVQHWSKPIDATKEIQQIVAEGKAIDKDADPKNTVELQTYQSDGVRASRGGDRYRQAIRLSRSRAKRQ